MMKNLYKLLISVSLPLIIGGLAGYATSSNINNWFKYLEKPWFNPPNYLFGPVWTVLYILMGISFFLIWKAEAGETRIKALRGYFIQLILNFAWSFIFFYFHQTGLAFVEIVLLWLAIAFMIFSFWRVNKVSAYLQIPYLLWVSFAACLNFAIWYLNR